MYKRILVPTDGSDTARAGILEACKLAQEQGAQVRLVHVVEAIPLEGYAMAYDRINESIREGAASALLYAQTVAKQAGITAETQLIDAMGAQAGECIIKAAKEWPADLIVCGTHGRRGLRRIVMGSDAEYIVRHTPVPILLIREEGRYARMFTNEARAD